VQLDKTRIAIRERNYLDVLDLALHVIRAYARPLALAFALGALPMMALNWWLLREYAELDFEIGAPAAYVIYMLILVFFEAPFATAPITLYLGNAVFTERPGLRRLARTFLDVLPQLFLLQGLLRLWYFRWPFLNHVILLERNPLVARDPRQKSTRKRALEVHAGFGADLFARALFSLMIGTVLLLSIWLSVYAASAVLLAEYGWDNSMLLVWFPLALWLVVGYFAVARFLFYLDLRIRREGWEVELILRAEGARWSRVSP
jgi:hypothetical protein